MVAERTVTNPGPRVPGPATTAAAAGRRAPATERRRPGERRAPAEETHSPTARAGHLSAPATAAHQHSYLGDTQTKDTERDRAGPETGDANEDGRMGSAPRRRRPAHDNSCFSCPTG